MHADDTLNANLAETDSSNLLVDNKKSLRIIALAPHVVENLYAIGAGDLIVATTSYANYPKEANDIPRIGNYSRIQIEQVLSYEPDVVIAWHTGNPLDDIKKIESLGIKVVYSDPKKLEDVASELRKFGQLTGLAKTAEQVAMTYTTKLNQIKQQYQGKKPLVTFYELWSSPLTTATNGAWPEQAINVCGTENIFADAIGDYPQVGLEQVIASSPQIVIQPKSETQNYVDQIDWSKWTQIPAGKYNLVIHPISDLLHRMTPRFIIGLEKLCADIDLAREKLVVIAQEK
ncbi:helical backbone metal receptor [Marinifaba aquimaris]|uniref:helical backbone metal receptor n=1 Tax=Marinifaba aquimaris TaxID=2741323 RepID=UPI001572982F